MEINFCLKMFLLLGIHPSRPLNKLLITFNNALSVCVFVLTLLKCYFDRDLRIVESCNGIIIVTVKYLTLILGRNTTKRILAATEHFWTDTVADDRVAYYKQYLKRVEHVYKYVIVNGWLLHIIMPFIFKDRVSIFNAYIPPHIPHLIFYAFEFYAITFVAVSFLSFNFFVCFSIISVAVQFRLVNLKIEELNLVNIESRRDIEEYERTFRSIVRYQQFLIRFVEDLNRLLSVPIALLMVSTVTMMCVCTYVRTINQRSVFEEIRLLLVVFSVAAEFFVVYGLPAQLLMNESAETADTIYSKCGWYLPNLRSLRSDFLMMIMRSQRSVSIRAGNYHVINNSTILRMLKTAYTFYTFIQELV